MHLPPIIIAIICFALIFSLFVVDCNKIKKESWVNYQILTSEMLIIRIAIK